MPFGLFKQQRDPAPDSDSALNEICSNTDSLFVELFVCKASIPCTNGFVVGGESRLLSDELYGTSTLV
jgi:hypothetical protein